VKQLTFNTWLQIFHISDNNLETTGAIKIASALHKNKSLTEFIGIVKQHAVDIATVLKCNTCRNREFHN